MSSPNEETIQAMLEARRLAGASAALRYYPITNADEYKSALDRVESLMDVAKGSSEGAELEILGMLIDAYESKTFPIDVPEPIVEPLKEACAAAYQIIGHLSSEAGISDRPEVLKVMDYFLDASDGIVRPVGEILPFTVQLKDVP